MRTLIRLIVFFTFVNTLALAMFIGWLWRSDRLDRARIEQVRAILAPTISAVEAEAEEADAEAERRRQAKLAEAQDRELPLSSGAHDWQITRVHQQERLARRRLEDARTQLLDQIGLESRTVEERDSDLESKRRAWEASIAADRDRGADEQLTKVVRRLEGLAPKQAKAVLVELVRTGREDQAVIYLDEMAARPSGKIFREFKTPEEIALATRLLESLRQLGPASGPTEETGDAASPDRAD